MTGGSEGRSKIAMAFLLRSVGYFLFWLVLAGADSEGLVPGVSAAFVASWVSLGLMPPGQLAFRPLAAAGLFFRFLGQSIVAGLTVARIALHPRMPLRPGIIAYPPHFPAGPRRDAFATLASLLPGTLPSGPDGKGGIAVHCLDTEAPVAAQLAEEERRLAGALRAAP
jgi:multicomponent Na+:H+ antiporter subunit E